MRISLTGKLFAALFGTACITIALVVVRTGWGLRYGYEEYANTAALSNMNPLVENLEEIYQAGHGWSNLGANPALWTNLVSSAELAGGAGPPSNAPRPGVPVMGRGRPVETAGPEDQTNFVRYFALEDASGRVIFGVPDSMPHAARRALTLGGKNIGQLLFDPGPQVAGLQAGFLAARVRDLYFTAAAALLFSAFAAALLSRNILMPIRVLKQAARQLSAGNYQARIAHPRADELGDLERDINSLAAALHAAEESQRRWVADTSHELRTPLAVMRAQIEALQDGVYTATPAVLAELQQQVQRLTRLVGDLQDLSRADAGALSVQIERVRPGALLADVLAGFAPLRTVRSIALQAESLEQSPAEVWGDPERLRQVFGNLVTNAISYTDPGGVIRAAIKPQGNNLLIEIEDSAPGIGTGDPSRLFGRFFRAEASRNRQTGGSGLGLAICRAIVDAHGGSISADHSPLGGLAIAITLPLATGAAR